MRVRSCYIPTLKETPADAEVISHKLLVRAGLIRKITSGVYTYMPLALRALRKIETVVREEMALVLQLEPDEVMDYLFAEQPQEPLPASVN